MATNIQTLLESSNEYRSMQKEAAKMVNKWSQSGLLEGLDKRSKQTVAVLLENQAKRIITEANQTNIGGSTFKAADGEQWAGVALPLVRKVFAQIVAKDFVSVQPMSLPSGLVFYLDLKYGTGWNGRKDGESLYGNVSDANRKMKVNEDVAGGLYGAGQFGYSINQHLMKTDAAAETLAEDADIAEATNFEVLKAAEGDTYYRLRVPVKEYDEDNKVWNWSENVAIRYKNDRSENTNLYRFFLNPDKSYVEAYNYLKKNWANGAEPHMMSEDPTILPDLEGVRAFIPVALTAAEGADAAHAEGIVQYVNINKNWTKLVEANNKLYMEFVYVVKEGEEAPGTVGGILYHVQPVDNNRGDFEAQADRAVDKSIEIPEIDVKLASEPIVAKTRKLKTQWTPEFAQDLNAYHSIDPEAELTSIMSEYISMEIDLELLDMLIQDAVTTDHWSAKNNNFWNGSEFVNDINPDVSGYYNTQGGWFQTLGTKIQKVSNKIHQKTLRGGATFIVCSPTVATILESIPGFAASTDGDKWQFAMGVQKVGSLNSRWQVYKNPYMTENVMLMGYKGSQFLECGAVYAPYIPLMMTPLVYDPETFTPRKGIMTRYAKKMLRPEYYGKIFVSGLETI